MCVGSRLMRPGGLWAVKQKKISQVEYNTAGFRRQHQSALYTGWRVVQKTSGSQCSVAVSVPEIPARPVGSICVLCVGVCRGKPVVIDVAARLGVRPAETGWHEAGGMGRGRGCWGAVTTQVSQTGRRESFQSDVVNGFGLDDGAGNDSDRTAVTLSSTACCHL